MEESIGKRPVWPEYDLEVLGLVLIIAERMLLKCCFFLGWMSSQGSRCDRAEQRLFCSLSRWPFTVKGYWERCLDMRFADRPVHEVKWPLLMAAMKIIDGVEVCSVKVFGKFAFSNVLAGDVVCLVWVVERW